MIQDWAVEGMCKLIWTDESAFNIGGVAGNTWVTGLPKEEYLEACLDFTFHKLETIMVWGCIYESIKSPLVFWDKVLRALLLMVPNIVNILSVLSSLVFILARMVGRNGLSAHFIMFISCKTGLHYIEQN